ncbi:Zn-dependent hydrolase of the beta-lactamase fold-like protein [Streptomyces bingchenggensis BCW-1]|uniref:Zn-dependent hydrolase of the beta-lactamase fold-like protein n=1 Tax=Streptomyces bingchenggensis (strain BCW-1) TaxID=749414 RepID=D7BZJ4_STRBB|nr:MULTISPECIES: MBL fold metallo-hydrolase [Streptomyces]ADI09899.1 Zn-dependent hydrolase of the beta-lactamase fold-like protein [Streptomyces bingchenggensis BCW-1]
MRITKFGHACVRLQKNGRAVAVDPGAMTPEPGVLEDVEAVLITHEHFDHFDPERLRETAAPIYTCPGAARHLAEFGERVHVVHGGDSFSVAGFAVSVAGEKHHFSHPDAPPVDNVGFLIDNAVFHPGDALTLIDAPTLLLPGQAPWLTVPVMIGYLREMAPRRAYAIHDGLLNEWGLKVLDDALKMECQRAEADIRRLHPGESVDV